MKVALVALLALGVAITLSKYAEPEGYEKLSASAKRDKLWELIEADKGKSGEWPSVFQLASLFWSSLKPTGHHNKDFMPEGRQKLIHSKGAVAKVMMAYVKDPPGNYTGMFQAGNSQYGLIRASTATPASEAGLMTKASYVPGISLKFLRDGKPSSNFMAMYQLQGQESFNFFEHPFMNHVSGQGLDMKLKALKLKFEYASTYAGQIGLSEMASFDQSGKEVDNPKFPFALYFQPNPRLTKMFEGEKESDIATVFPSKLQGDEILYKVYAFEGPKSPKGELIATLKLQSKFKASKFADESLFFRHTWFENDLAHRPEWKNEFDREKQGLPRWKGKVDAWDHNVAPQASGAAKVAKSSKAAEPKKVPKGKGGKGLRKQ